MNKIKDYFKSLSKDKLKLVIRLIIIAVMLIVGFVQMAVQNHNDRQNNTGNKIQETAKASTEAGKSGDSRTSTPEPTSAPITPSPTEKSDGHGDDWTAADDVQHSVADSKKAVVCKASGIEDKIEDILDENGQYETDSTTDYVNRDMTTFASENPIYNNLHKYTATVSYAKDKKFEVDGSDLYMEEGDTAYLTAYITIDGQKATIHKIFVDGDTLIDDGQVPEDADQK